MKDEPFFEEGKNIAPQNCFSSYWKNGLFNLSCEEPWEGKISKYPFSGQRFVPSIGNIEKAYSRGCLISKTGLNIKIDIVLKVYE